MGGYVARVADLFSRERTRALRDAAWEMTKTVLKRPMGAAGAGIVLGFIVLAAFAPWIVGEYPNYASGVNISQPFSPPNRFSASFPTTADTFLASDRPSASFGSSPLIFLNRSASNVTFGLLRFAVSLFPADAPAAAQLDLVVNRTTALGWPVTVVASRLAGDWSETNGTWADTAGAANDTETATAVNGPLETGDHLLVDVTAQLGRFRMIGGTTSFSVLLRIGGSADNISFAFDSKEGVGSPPTLRIQGTNGFLLGTDRYGRSNFALLVYGSQVSLVVGFASSFVAMILGAVLGLLSGYYGKFWDQIISRITDFFLVIPWLPFVLVLVAVLGRSFVTIVISIAVISWPTTVRVVRSKVLTVKTLGYVERARAIGARDGRIIFHHVMPVVAPLIFANMILTIANSIFTESFLAFFGLGDPARVSWGTMIQTSYDASRIFAGAYWEVLPPGIAITALVLAFTMVSHVLEELLNPKFRKR